jgi:ABC-2 type transport system permease protein
MNTQASPTPESSPGSQVIAPQEISTMRLFYWSLRRELWENRSIYVGPLAVATLILVASLISAIHLPGRLHGLTFDPTQQHELIEQPYDYAALLLMFTTFVVAIFYSLDAFQGERRDRSILFWKSLPVSDFTTVLAKASIPLLLLPLLTFAITVATQAIMLLIGTARLLGSGQSATLLWGHLPFFRMSVQLLYHLVTVHGLWWAPFYGWMLLISAWARRVAFLWATLPLLAIGMVEKIAFNTTYFAGLLQVQFMGGPEGASSGGQDMSMASLTPASPVQFLISPRFWIGLAITAIFLAAAVRLRRNREPV